MTLITEAKNGTPAGEATVLAKVVVCESQPATIEGVRTILRATEDLEFAEGASSLSRAIEIAQDGFRGILIVDKTFGMQPILEWMAEANAVRSGAALVVVWGVSVTEAEALRFLQAGARGILRKTAALAAILACLRTVAAGRSWMEDCVFRDPSRAEHYPHSELTAREQQVLELVEQGCENKEIATELGIRPGTVKIHLKHIFEKTGIRGRYGLALSGWRDRGPVRISA
jgi:two-component system, NarL family, nitrate/nitrite response regulator NarL